MARLTLTEALAPADFGAIVSLGCERANAALGLAIPEPDAVLLARFFKQQRGFIDTDRFFAALLYELCGAGGAEERSFVDLNAALFSRRLDLDLVRGHVADIERLANAGVARRALQMLDIRPIDLRSTFDRPSYVWTKINHVWWELAASTALDGPRWWNRCTRRGLEKVGARNAYFRDRHLYIESGCCHLVAATLRAMAGPQSRLVNDQSAFAVGFSNGDRWARDLDPASSPHVRGAMVGCGPFIAAALEGKGPFEVADGAAPRQLVESDALGDFGALARSGSDAVAFVTPAHLKSISLKDFGGEVFNVVAPSRHIHEFWPSTLAYAVGPVEWLAMRHARLTVFVQAAVISAPICAALAHAARDSGASLRVYDFGQVLDLALPAGADSGPWLRALAARDAAAGRDRGIFTLT